MFQQQSHLNQVKVYQGEEIKAKNNNNNQTGQTKSESKDSIHIQNTFLSLFSLKEFFTQRL